MVTLVRYLPIVYHLSSCFVVCQKPNGSLGFLSFCWGQAWGSKSNHGRNTLWVFLGSLVKVFSWYRPRSPKLWLKESQSRKVMVLGFIRSRQLWQQNSLEYLNCSDRFLFEEYDVARFNELQGFQQMCSILNFAGRLNDTFRLMSNLLEAVDSLTDGIIHSKFCQKFVRFCFLETFSNWMIVWAVIIW